MASAKLNKFIPTGKGGVQMDAPQTIRKENIMKKTFLTLSTITVALLAGSQTLRADHMAGKSANDIIGRKVVNAQNEDLGKVQDLIINVESGRAPYAVIATGGLTSRTKVAVPTSALSCPAGDKSALILSATREQLQAASKTPTGAWATEADAEWSKKVDGFYGEPMPERSVRETARDTLRDTTTNEVRTYVRASGAKGGAEALMTQDTTLCQKIAESTDVCNIQVQNGVAHLYGQVENDEARQKLENQVRSVEGVKRVESHLKVKNQ